MSDQETIARQRATIQHLELKLHQQKWEIRWMQVALERKNREMDALHFVWCDGGCAGGTHRYTPDALTKEVVEEAVRNTTRLVRWWNNSEFRTLPVNDRFYYIDVVKKAREAEIEQPNE